MKDMAHERPIDILLVEDDPADIRLTMDLFRESRIRNRLHVVEDGEEALAFLRREGSHRGEPRPDLILLDLNLPRLDGREVLSAIKGDPDLRRIPVVILTSSAAEEDIVRSYELFANCYLTKPVGLDRFIGVIRSIEQFWLSIVKLPPGQVTAGRVDGERGKR